MKNTISVAILGSTGYVGLELIFLLSNHPYVSINFLGSNSNVGRDIKEFDNRIKKNLPKLQSIENFNDSLYDVVFLALPHKFSHLFVKKNINNSKVIDLSADFRLDDAQLYDDNYKNKHSCPELLNEFVYGLPEINFDSIKKSTKISVPGCYPTSILLPLIPLISNNLIKNDNIIIDSKSGYSGAGKKYNKNEMFKGEDFNFYNYNTNQHRHMSEISQELNKHNNSEIKFSFNPHIMANFRGMMSTIYCDLNSNSDSHNVYRCFKDFYSNFHFVKILNENDEANFFTVNNTNNCLIKLFQHYESSKIIIVSLIDNLLKGASGQAVQCMNIMFKLNEKEGLIDLRSD